MPNPFLRAQLKTSKAPVDRPKPIAPVPENQYAGDVYPYRGIENHGVADQTEPYSDYWGLEGRPVVVYAAEPDDSTPVPVRIVSGTKSREFRRFRTDRRLVDGNASQVVSRNDERTTCKITNMSVDKTLWVAPSPSDLLITGYPLGPGKEFVTSSEDSVYMMNGTDTTAVQVAVLIEYVVSE
jgi:hypothetical protein